MTTGCFAIGTVPVLAHLAPTVHRWLVETLRVRFGIDDHIRIKIMPFRGRRGFEDALACYRPRSQFRSSVVFWVNESFPEFVRSCNAAPEASVVPLDLEMALRMTLAHEYGHVVAEFAACLLPTLHARIQSSYPDEEEFAEDLARFLVGDGPLWAAANFFTEVFREYRVAAFED